MAKTPTWNKVDFPAQWVLVKTDQKGSCPYHVARYDRTGNGEWRTVSGSTGHTIQVPGNVIAWMELPE